MGQKSSPTSWRELYESIIVETSGESLGLLFPRMIDVILFIRCEIFSK